MGVKFLLFSLDEFLWNPNDSSQPVVTMDLSIAGWLYVCAFVLALASVWSPMVAERWGYNRRRVNMLLNTGAIMTGSIASIIWIGSDSHAPKIFTEIVLAVVLFTVGFVSLIAVEFIKTGRNTEPMKEVSDDDWS